MRPFVGLCFPKAFFGHVSVENSTLEFLSEYNHPGVSDGPNGLNFRVFDSEFPTTDIFRVRFLNSRPFNPSETPVLDLYWPKATSAGRLSDSLFEKVEQKRIFSWLQFCRQNKPEVRPKVECRQTYHKRTFKRLKLKNTGFTIDQTKIGLKKLKLLRWKYEKMI